MANIKYTKYLINTLNTVTGNYKRTEQNGEPHSNPSLVLASYSLRSRLQVWGARVCHHNDGPRM